MVLALFGTLSEPHRRMFLACATRVLLHRRDLGEPTMTSPCGGQVELALLYSSSRIGQAWSVGYPSASNTLEPYSVDQP